MPYCSLLAWPVILLTDNYKAYPLISSSFGFLIVIIYLLSCEFIKVHIFRATRVLLFIIIFSTSQRIIFISSCASTQGFAHKFIIKWTTSLSHLQLPARTSQQKWWIAPPRCAVHAINWVWLWHKSNSVVEQATYDARYISNFNWLQLENKFKFWQAPWETISDFKNLWFKPPFFLVWKNCPILYNCLKKSIAN